MDTAPLLLILAWGDWLIPLYWFCLTVGGGMLLLSFLGGHSTDSADAASGADADVGLDAGADLHADVGDVHVEGADLHVDGPGGLHAAGHGHAGHAGAHSATGLSTWLSLRFIIFFVAVFGAVGVITTYTTGAGRGATLALACVMGLALGQVVHHVFRIARRTSGNSAPRTEDYIHKLARVTIPVRPPDLGEVTLHVRGGQRYVPAVSDGSGRAFAAHEEVVVVDYRDGVAHIVSPEDFQRLDAAPSRAVQEDRA